MTQLTARQKQTIDRLLETYPQLKPESVNGYYDYDCHSRNWFIYIDIPGVSFSTQVVLTRCDYKTTANDKGVAFRDYIASKKVAQS